MLARFQEQRFAPLYSQPRTIVPTPRFLYVVDNALTLPAAPWNELGYAEAFDLARTAYEETEDRPVKALLVFSTFDEGGTALFYTPLANDVTGLGVGRAAELFDDTPGSDLDGLIWMGPVDSLEAAGDAYFEEAFVHEIAHRWAAYAKLEYQLLDPGILRGRQGSHWSFLLDSQTSPMEGNGWIDAGNGRFRTGPRVGSPFFSPLDLYFMGVAGPDEVEPFRLITAFSDVDPTWLAVRSETTPAHRLGVEVTLSVISDEMISIDDIIASNGRRAPAARASLTWPIAVVLISNGIVKADRADLERLDRRIERLSETFRTATYGRIELDLAIATAGSQPLGSPCSAVAECDRSRSEVCAAPPGGAAICTRTCANNDDCGPDHCCSLTALLCAVECPGETIIPGETDAGLDPGESPAPDELDEGGSGCGCEGTQQRSNGHLGLLAVFFAGCAGRLRRRSRG